MASRRSCRTCRRPLHRHLPFVPEMPHGGFKHSGYGKDLSVYGFEDYTRIKHVMSNIEA
jgi:betaine-aldehyde dehydrogenase